MDLALYKINIIIIIIIMNGSIYNLRNVSRGVSPTPLLETFKLRLFLSSMSNSRLHAEPNKTPLPTPLGHGRSIIDMQV